MTYVDGTKKRGVWVPKGRKNNKNLSSYDDKSDAYWTEVGDQWLNKNTKKIDKKKLDKTLEIKK